MARTSWPDARFIITSVGGSATLFIQCYPSPLQVRTQYAPLAGHLLHPNFVEWLCHVAYPIPIPAVRGAYPVRTFG
jgi:hypothetical protein